ncbi:YeeE/YedE family protein [Vibrio sp. B1Z05]|uniref:YeeE/YedE family protein n=1 Tax=Vibrio sp. B1Z05 TaxID=2654980 RepID=UPI00128CE88C|nr:YeeE/YedE family protein [Vibrio sp. B1Z05]MPW36473.1 YeeE/YedE family protein [Vibrio sp. B1Z05]
MFKIVSLIAGVLFGLGMAVSGMVDPVKVIGFLDVAGNWDPSLAFVMGGALSVFLPVYLLVIKKREKSVLGLSFSLATNNAIDKRLLTGASIFGIGWGLVGICPGPVISSLGSGNIQAVLFVVAMLVGFVLGDRVTNLK